MFRVVLFVLAISAVVLAAAQGEVGPQRFDVPIPDNWRDATRFRLVLEGVTLPGNVPLKLRVSASGDRDRETFLGSVGIEALSSTHTEPRRIKSLRLDVTRSLKRLLEGGVSSAKLNLLVQPVDAHNSAIAGLKWSVETVRLETQPK